MADRVAVPPAPPSREPAATKARRYLCEGRVVIREARHGFVAATVRGDGMTHDCGYANGGWWCLCEARTTACSHLIAVRLVTSPDL